MVVGLADTRLTAKEILNLSVGDVIMTEKGFDQPLEVYVEGRPLFRGSAGLFKGHKAVRVGKAIARPEELIELQLKGVPSPAARRDPECPIGRPPGKRSTRVLPAFLESAAKGRVLDGGRRER